METTYVYEWMRNGVAIPGAESSTYTCVDMDVGDVVTCAVTATNSVGSSLANSQPTSVVAAAEASTSFDTSIPLAGILNGDILHITTDTAAGFRLVEIE